MRRLIFMLAAGLLAGGTVLTTAGAASADTTAARHADWRGETAARHADWRGGTAARHADAGCTDLGFSDLRYISAKNVSYYLGTPNKLSSGAAAILKPNLNSTTTWDGCVFSSGQFLITSQNRGWP
jgi:hypothetical protein